MSDLQVFRQETRDWLENNCPLSMRQPARAGDDMCWGGRNFKFSSEDQKLWMQRMAAKGWTAPDWPAEYGGGGLDRAQHKILKEELARINARSPLDSFGIWMIGPAILKFGSEALKQQHLPPLFAVRFAGVRATLNLARGQIWLVYSQRLRIEVIILLLTVKRSGLPMAIRPIGCFVCCALIQMPRSRWVSA